MSNRTSADGGADDLSVGEELALFVPFASLAHVAADPGWLWEGLLAPGELTLLAGLPFVGKSRFIGGLMAAPESGTPFLGLTTKKASTLLLTEESQTLVNERAAQMGLLEAKSYVAHRGTRVNSYPWEELIERETEAARSAGHTLLVIDTFAGRSRLGPEEENDAGAVTTRLHTLHVAAGEGLAVLLVHHVTKNNGSIRGSGAFSGSADITIRLNRKKNSTRITLLTKSRYETTPAKLGGNLVSVGKRSMYIAENEKEQKSSPSGGKTEQTKRSKTDELLLQTLNDAGLAGLTYRQIDDIENLSADMAKRRFPLWYPETIGRHGDGLKCAPYRWFALAA